MTSIFNKLKQALTKSSGKISQGIDHIFFKKKLDEKTLEELEELLISADLGSIVASNLTSQMRRVKFDTEISVNDIKEKLSEFISEILENTNQPLNLKDTALNVILVCGVNGGGKTTTIGKLAASYISQGKRVVIAACDTFRAAAVDQIDSWAIKSGALLIKGEEGADPASVAYSAMEQSIENGIDILLIDTAGRLHNKTNLMEELGKIIRVIKKIDGSAEHHSILVIDATTGQNAYNQVEQFTKVADITGLIVTKLDGTAKAGVIIGIIQKFGLPIHFIGIGEKTGDIKAFNSKEFADAIVGI